MFISKVKCSKVMGVAFCNRGLLYFATGAVAFCDRLHPQRICCAGLRSVFPGADAALDQSGFFERVEVTNHRRFVHLAFLSQRFQAWETRSAAFVVVIRQPIKHDLGGRFQPPLLHRQRRHVMAHGLSFRVVETPPAMLSCGQRIRLCALPMPAVCRPLRLSWGGSSACQHSPPRHFTQPSPSVQVPSSPLR